MRTSLNDIQEMEQYLQGTMGEAEAILFAERLRTDLTLRINVSIQRKVMTLIKMYHRKRVKMQLEDIHERLFNDPVKATWRERLLDLFHSN